MLLFRAGSVAVLIAAFAAFPLFAARAHRAPTSGHARPSSHKVKTAVPKKIKGQRAIDSDRAKEIQTALIREKYLTGEPTGQWDSATEAAMQRYQADHGWQTKLTPDSRALIKLGLGPNHTSGAISPAVGAQSPNASAAESGTSASLHTSSLY